MSTLTRRTALTTIAAAPVAVALPTRASDTEYRALDTGDVQLRRLWAEYVAAFNAHREACETHRKLRKPFDEEFDRQRVNYQHRGGFGELYEILWPKYNLEPSSRAWCQAGRKLRRIVKAIRKAKAETPFGVGVKLSAVEDPSNIDYYELAPMVDEARHIIGEMTDTDFVAATGPMRDI
jgi:hypothetical protein